MPSLVAQAFDRFELAEYGVPVMVAIDQHHVEVLDRSQGVQAAVSVEDEVIIAPALPLRDVVPWRRVYDVQVAPVCLQNASRFTVYGYDRFEASAADAVLRGGGGDSPEDRSDDGFVGRLARNYVDNVSAVKEAYARHPDGAKVLIRYEDLRATPLDCVSYICDSLGIEVEGEQLEQAVERHAFENIPPESRGRASSAAEPPPADGERTSRRSRRGR